MSTIYTIHPLDPEHLDAVMAEMATLGAPTLRVVDCGDYWMLIEGNHRLEAARQLGLTPEFVVLDQDELIAADDLDLEGFVAGETYTAGEIAGECYSPHSGCYTLSDDGLERVFEARYPIA